MGVHGNIKAEDLWLIEVSEQQCAYCDVGLEESQGTFDHVVPLDRGGRNNSFNIVRCCVRCNRRKFTKTVEQLAVHEMRLVTCARPGCGNQYQPRWAEYEAGRARLCSRRCSALLRWQKSA
jgi:hypothetical protein